MAQSSLPFPQYKGEEGGKDRVQAKAIAKKFWLDLEAYCADRGLNTDAEKRSVLSRSFPRGSDAESWYTGWTGGSGKDVTAWAEAKAAFEERFVKPDTLPQLQKLRDSLQQKPNESVAAFADRCIIFQNNMDDLVKAGFNTLLRNTITAAVIADDADRRRVRTALLNGLVLQLSDTYGALDFCAGLQPRLKTKVMESQTATTLRTMKEVAERCEQVRDDVQQQQPLSTVVAAMSTQGTANNSRGAGRGGNSSPYNLYKDKNISVEYGGARPPWLSNEMLPKGTCYKCGNTKAIPATHNARNCRVPPERFRWNETTKLLNLKPPQRQQQQQLQQPAPGPSFVHGIAASVNPTPPPQQPAQQGQPQFQMAGPWPLPGQQGQVVLQQGPMVPQPQGPQNHAIQGFPFGGSYADF